MHNIKKRPVSLRRSWLFVGGADEKKIKKAAASCADVCIQDLEDFCPIELKEKAKKIIPDTIKEWKTNNKIAAVRINPLETVSGKAELEAAIKAKADAILLPKVKYRHQIVSLDKQIRNLELQFKIPKHQTEIIPNIEDAKGYKNMDEIFIKNKSLVAALIASEDMASSLNILNTKKNALLEHIRKEFHISCCANNINTIDMPYVWTDETELIKQTILAKELGIFSKSTVNSNHCNIINQILTPSLKEYKESKEIIKVFEIEVREGNVQTLFKGKLLEMPSYIKAKKVCTRYEKFLQYDI